MEINYKGVLCRLGTYRANGEDKPTLYYISSPDNETMYKAGFEQTRNIKKLSKERKKDKWMNLIQRKK